jgi:hypothetical protein
VRAEVRERFARMQQAADHVAAGVDGAREYVEAMLGLEVWSHKLFAAVKAEPHGTHTRPYPT